jgi:hypothetical protein
MDAILHAAVDPGKARRGERAGRTGLGPPVDGTVYSAGTDVSYQVEGAMSDRRKWGYASFGVGFVLSLVFGAAYIATSGGLQSGSLAAGMLCFAAAANGLAVGLSGSLKAGKWTGFAVGAIGFVGWGNDWLTITCAAGDTYCTGLRTAFGWGAISSVVASTVSLLPGLRFSSDMD